MNNNKSYSKERDSLESNSKDWNKKHKSNDNDNERKQKSNRNNDESSSSSSPSSRNRSKSVEIENDEYQREKRQKTIEDLENAAAYNAAKFITLKAEEEVQLYLLSSDFKNMVDSLKQRERIRIMKEIDQEIQEEKEVLLKNKKKVYE
jgi:hypothetical protein